MNTNNTSKAEAGMMVTVNTFQDGDEVSKLRIDDVTRFNSGNYTCAPSNARAASVMVHVVDGNGIMT